MRILAIETSCDETACAVVENGRTVLASAIHSQVAEHQLYGGVVPEIASRRHTENIVPICALALAQSGFTLRQMDALAVTFAPGLVGALLVGVNFAKGLAMQTGLPLIPVHHIRAHIAANYLAYPDLKPPFLSLVVSGGHSHLIEVLTETEFHIIGRTRDDAAGEAFDKAARAMGLPYPGGLWMDKAARRGNPMAYVLPRPKVDGAPYDFSFSGLKTAVLNQMHNMTQKGQPVVVDDMAASFEHAVVDVLADRTFSAAKNLGYSTVVLAGGVSANTGLRERFGAECHRRGLRLCAPPLALCGDNAAMIGAQGFYEYQAGNRANLSLNAISTLPVSYKIDKNGQISP